MYMTITDCKMAAHNHKLRRTPTVGLVQHCIIQNSAVGNTSSVMSRIKGVLEMTL